MFVLGTSTREVGMCVCVLCVGCVCAYCVLGVCVYCVLGVCAYCVLGVCVYCVLGVCVRIACVGCVCICTICWVCVYCVLGVPCVGGIYVSCVMCARVLGYSPHNGSTCDYPFLVPFSSPIVTLILVTPAVCCVVGPIHSFSHVGQRRLIVY